jgi:hypothetical protein
MLGESAETRRGMGSATSPGIGQPALAVHPPNGRFANHPVDRVHNDDPVAMYG